MASRAVQMRGKQFTDVQTQYLDIIVNEYCGYVPRGEKKKIAERLGVTPTYLSHLDNGSRCPAWLEEKKIRIRSVIPLLDPLYQAAALNELYDSAIAKRREKNFDLTNKDPLEILAAATKLTQVTSPKSVNVQQNIINQAPSIDLGSLDNDQLSQAIEMLVGMIRSGGLEEVANVIEGQFSEIRSSQADTPSDATGTVAPQITDGS